MSTTTTNQQAPSGSLPPDVAGASRKAVSTVADRMQRLRSGELGAWPVVIGLIVIWVVFESLNDAFLTAQNLSNLTLQIMPYGVISVGIVLVLLLGEIDLSVGSVAGVGAAVTVFLSIQHGWPDWMALVVVLVLGALIGLLQGFFFAKVGVPAFVVTLAGNLGWLGFQLWLLFPNGTVNIPYNGFTAQRDPPVPVAGDRLGPGRAGPGRLLRGGRGGPGPPGQGRPAGAQPDRLARAHGGVGRAGVRRRRRPQPVAWSTGRGADLRRSRGRDRPPVAAHPLRPGDLRRRWQRRGGPTGRHQRGMGPDVDLRGLLDDRGLRWCPVHLAGSGRRTVHRRRRRAAHRDRRLPSSAG